MPANPIDTGQAMHEGAALRLAGDDRGRPGAAGSHLGEPADREPAADGALGNYRPLRALADAVAKFDPDRLVICTLPEDQSAWLRFDVVERAREAYNIPVTHIVVRQRDLAVGGS